MKAKQIGYWVVTVLVALAFLGGGAGDLSKGKDMVEGMNHLGYPAYLMTLLGAWKLAGAVAVLIPGTPRLKEWAYAGMIFDLTGAAFSHAASGDAAGKVVTPLVIGAVVMASWALRPAGRTLAGAASADAGKATGAQAVAVG